MSRQPLTIRPWAGRYAHLNCYYVEDLGGRTVFFKGRWDDMVPGGDWDLLSPIEQVLARLALQIYYCREMVRVSKDVRYSAANNLTRPGGDTPERRQRLLNAEAVLQGWRDDLADAEREQALLLNA